MNFKKILLRTLLVATSIYTNSVFAAYTYTDVGSFKAPTNATQMEYSSIYNTLVVKNSASAISVIDLTTGQNTMHFANYRFTDISLSPDGRYIFAADYGGENIGYGTPANTSYVHRLDISNSIWSTKSAYIAGNIEATSNDTFVLMSSDQWVTFTNNSWGTDANSVTPLGSTYYASVYSGNFDYDTNTGRLIHGNSGSSSQEIQAFRLVNNQFIRQEDSGVYGSAQSYGGSVIFATDGSAFYYGNLQVDALDVTHNLNTFPELIYAATGDVAFGAGNYFDATSGDLLGSLGFNALSYAFNPSGKEFWAYNPNTSTIHHFQALAAVPEPESSALMLVGLSLMGFVVRQNRK
jgi:hypothetical protein